MRANRCLRLLPSALLAALCLSLAAPAADASGNKHTGITLHGVVQHPVKPVGNRRVSKPIGGNRKPGRTILPKKP